KDSSSRFCRSSPEFDGLVGQVGVIKSLCRHCLPVILLYGISILKTLELGLVLVLFGERRTIDG
ncbi:hypothetical protein, partial [Mesotoga sp.]|uniref:hypothetical protein n=1 Tax=Mesotoga sp. TaxID=2053577 RepID=UPI0035634827